MIKATGTEMCSRCHGGTTKGEDLLEGSHGFDTGALYHAECYGELCREESAEDDLRVLVREMRSMLDTVSSCMDKSNSRIFGAKITDLIRRADEADPKMVGRRPEDRK